MGKSVTEAQEQWHPIQGPWLEARRDDPARVRADMIHIERGSPDFGFTATKHLDRTPARCSFREHERPRRTLAFRQAVEGGVFAAALVPPPYDTREPWPPAFRERECLEVTMAPTDLVLAARLAGELATAHGVHLRIRVFESPYEHGNPLPLLRDPVSLHSPCSVVFWSAGPDRMRTLRAVREVLGGDLAVTKEKLAAAPIELLVSISEHDARAAVDTLKAAGCEAEVIRADPQTKGHT